MEYVYLIEYRHPEDAKGYWNWLAICETEDIAKNWWSDSISAKHRWYSQHGHLYCKTHYNNGDPVTYRITRTSFYSVAWFEAQKRKAS